MKRTCPVHPGVELRQLLNDFYCTACDPRNDEPKMEKNPSSIPELTRRKKTSIRLHPGVFVSEEFLPRRREEFELLKLLISPDRRRTSVVLKEIVRAFFPFDKYIGALIGRVTLANVKNELHQYISALFAPIMDVRRGLDYNVKVEFRRDLLDVEVHYRLNPIPECFRDGDRYVSSGDPMDPSSCDYYDSESETLLWTEFPRADDESSR